MSIKSRIKRLFRRKHRENHRPWAGGHPLASHGGERDQGYNKKDITLHPKGGRAVADILAALEPQARNLAELTFEMEMDNPQPSTCEQIGEAAGDMFVAIAKETFAQMVASGCDSDIAAFSVHRSVETMFKAFQLRYSELVAHGNHGTAARQ